MGSSATRRTARSANQRMAMAHLPTSPLAEANVLPISVVMIRARSGSSASTRSAAVTISRARSPNVVRRYWSKQAAARPTRSSTSAGPWASKVHSTSPVAGLVVWKAMDDSYPSGAPSVPGPLARTPGPARSQSPADRPRCSGTARRKSLPVAVWGRSRTTRYCLGRL